MLQTFIDDVTRINFVVISAWPWCVFIQNLVHIFLYSPELLTFFRNSRWRPPPSWIFRLCEFGHSGLLIIWYLCMLCTKFGSNICYRNWDRRTYTSDVHLITSRELTSGFDFWSRDHFRMAVMHLPIKMVHCIYLYQGRSYWHFSEIKDGGRRHLGFLGYTNLAIASDVHLMTSSELTSGFDFWSCGHLRTAVMHLPIKFGADIFIQSGVVDIFPK